MTERYLGWRLFVCASCALAAASSLYRAGESLGPRFVPLAAIVAALALVYGFAWLERATRGSG